MVNTSSDSIRRSFVTFAAVNASLGTFMFFYVLTVFNSIQEILQDTVFPEASLNQISFLASSPYLGAVTGALFIEMTGKKLGRRFTMILTKVISIIGVILTLFPSITPLIFGRLLTGFDGGAAAVLVNIYITEISEDPLRGQLGVIPGVASALGILLAMLLGTLLPFFIERGVADIGYRILLAIPGVVSLIIILNLLFLFKFETPFYLVSQKKEKEAKEVLELLYDDEHSAKLKQIIMERDYIFQEKDVPIRDLFSPKYRKAFAIAMTVCNATALMGGANYMIFSNMIFSEGETSYYSYTPILFSNLIGIMSVFGSIITLVIMSRSARRKPLVIFGCASFTIINLSLTIIAFTSGVGHLAVKILVVLWVSVFSTTVSPVGTMYPAEVLPEIGVGVVMASGQAISFIVTQVFLPLQAALGYGYVFLIFTFFSVVVTVILGIFMIETKDRTKLEMLKLYGSVIDENEESSSLMQKTK